MVNKKHIIQYKAKGVVLYKVSFTLLGYRVRKSNLTKVEAETFYHKVRRDILSGNYNEDKKELDLFSSIKLSKFIRNYLVHLRRNTELRESSVRMELACLTRMAEIIGEDRKLKSLKPKTFIVAFQKFSNQENYSLNYRKAVRINTNKLIKWGLKNNYLQNIQLIEALRGKKERRTNKAFFTRAELETLFNEFDLTNEKEAYYYRFFFTQFQLALRVREVGAISQNDINFDDNTVFIHKTQSTHLVGNKVSVQGTKNNKTAILPVSPELKQVLKDQIDYKNKKYPEKECLFLGTKQGHNFDYTVHNRWLKRIAKRAGIKGNVSSHIFRRSWVCFGVEAGLPLNLLAAYSRHSPQVLLESYTEVKSKLFYQVFREFQPLNQVKVGDKKDNIFPQSESVEIHLEEKDND